MSATEMMIAEWAKHRAEGKRKGIDSRHEWQTAPEWAHREADEWLRGDEAWWLLVGTRLADEAIREATKEES